jgi:hypothetical protein
MSEARSEAETMFVAGNRGRGGAVLAVGLIAVFVPAIMLAVLIASGPRESKAWWVFVAVVLLVLCVPLEWPPHDLFI